MREEEGDNWKCTEEEEEEEEEDKEQVKGINRKGGEGAEL